MASDEKIDLFLAKNEAIFARLSRIYTSSENITLSKNSRATEDFMANTEILETLRSEFVNNLDTVNILRLKSTPPLKPSYDSLSSFDDIYCRLVRKRNKCETSFSSALINNNSPVRLPSIEIPAFDGRMENWPIFYESFKANIHENVTLTDSHRIQYLMGKLTENALRITSNFTPSAENYPQLWSSLVARYQDKRSLATYYLNSLLDIKGNIHNNSVSLDTFIEQFDSSVSALKQLNISELTDFIFLHIALRKVDSNTGQLFEMSVREKKVPTYSDFVTFMKSQVKIIERTSSKPLFSRSYNKEPTNNKINNPKSFIINNNNNFSCSVCNKGDHQHLYYCDKFNSLSAKNRFELIKSKNGCINCLSMLHTVSNCNSTKNCKQCHKKHHSLLHRNSSNENQTKTQTQSNSKDVVSLCTVNATKQSTVLLATAQVKTFSQGKSRRIRCLIDNASQNHIITKHCCEKLKLNIVSLSNSFIKGIGTSSRPIHGHVTINISSLISKHNFKIQCLVVDKITEKLPCQVIDSCVVKKLAHLPFADPQWFIPGEIELVIGAQLFPHIILNDHVYSSAPAPPALNTVFGYIFMGDVPVDNKMILSNNASASFLITNTNALNDTMRKFWELEEIPKTNFLSPDETACENLYCSSVTCDIQGRYKVALPFNKDPNELGNSFATAHRRFLALERKFKISHTLRASYDEVIRDYIDKGYLSDITARDDGSGYYIPHHAVIRNDKSSTKTRVVLDASAKTHSGLSLNDVLHIGPNLQADLFNLLLNFRLFPIALSADIRQMYLRIGVIDEHQKYQKIIYRFNPEDDVSVYNFTCVPFGLKSSAYLAMRTIRELASNEEHRFPIAAKIAAADLYMDDLVTSIDHSVGDRESISLANELITLFASGGFDLVKFASNSKVLMSNLPSSHCSPIEFDNDDNLKILGVKWDPGSDSFLFVVHPEKSACTKRIILSTVARLWDILGLVSPIILFAKLLIKDLWLTGIDWDSEPPACIVSSFNTLIEELPLLSNLRIPRHIGVSDSCHANIAAFADASLKAYGCVIYIQVTDKIGNISVNLVCSKSKVSPVKIVSLARLELCAALLLAKLVTTVNKTYSSRYQIDNIYAFSDSMIALSWIHSSPHRWSTFVANRVAKIQENLNPSQFYHVAGTENPSDCLSRGLLPSQILNHNLWWHGPPWLKNKISEWPLKPFIGSEDKLPELNTKALIITMDEPSILSTLASRISTWHKLLRVVVYVLKFINKCPRNIKIHAQDINTAEHYIITDVQRKHFVNIIEDLDKGKDLPRHLRSLSIFKDEKGILRIGGRLSNADLPYETQHPALLPKNDHVVSLIIDHYHKYNCHAGSNLISSLIRQKFWIISSRNVIRYRIKKCNFCFRNSPTNISPEMANLPSYRVCENKAFLHTGVDYAGPVNITLIRRRGQRSQKAFICLFICLVTKAVHIELASDLSADGFLAAFSRFISRRGTVSFLYSDNGTNFIGARSKLNEIYELTSSSYFQTKFDNELVRRRITWKTIPPRSPHFGGIWESNIKSVKTHLYRVIGSQILTYEELSTVLIQIEALLNSRPLCLSSEDPHPDVLTPAHFLMNSPIQYFPTNELSSTNFNLQQRKKLLDNIIVSYWKKWKVEYLHTLQTRQKWNTPKSNISIGTVVLLNEDNVPPLRWPLGIIENVFPGLDGIVRVVQVRTGSGSYKRSVVKVCPLPSQ